MATGIFAGNIGKPFQTDFWQLHKFFKYEINNQL